MMMMKGFSSSKTASFGCSYSESQTSIQDSKCNRSLIHHSQRLEQKFHYRTTRIIDKPNEDLNGIAFDPTSSKPTDSVSILKSIQTVQSRKKFAQKSLLSVPLNLSDIGKNNAHSKLLARPLSPVQNLERNGQDVVEEIIEKKTIASVSSGSLHKVTWSDKELIKLDNYENFSSLKNGKSIRGSVSYNEIDKFIEDEFTPFTIDSEKTGEIMHQNIYASNFSSKQNSEPLQLEKGSSVSRDKEKKENSVHFNSMETQTDFEEYFDKDFGIEENDYRGPIKLEENQIHGT